MQHSALDCELSGRRKATRLLTRHGKCRHSKSGQKRRGKLRITHDISKRSEEAFGRSQIGDWEGDTVAGRQEGTCLITQVDRMSGYLVGGKAARTAVNEATEKAFAGEVVLSVTLDRGKEFSDAKGAAGGAGDSRILLLSPPSLGEGDQRKHQRPSQGLVFEGQKPRRCRRQKGAGGVRFTQLKTAQAPGVEVSLGGLPSPVVALALRIRHKKSLNGICFEDFLYGHTGPHRFKQGGMSGSCEKNEITSCIKGISR